MKDDPFVEILPPDVDYLVIHRATLKALFDLGETATALYLFYMETAKKQQEAIRFTQTIKATGSYCCRGLGWGKQKYQTAKSKLAKSGLIESIPKRDANGKVTHWFVRLKYLANPEADLPSFWFTQKLGNPATNADNYNINADNYNLNACSKKSSPLKLMSLEDEAEEILNHFNEVYEKKFPRGQIKAMTKGKKTGLMYWREVYSLKEIKKAISNSVRHDFWEKVLRDKGPVTLLRTTNVQHEPVDYIGQFLSMPEEKSNFEKWKEEASAELGFEVQID